MVKLSVTASFVAIAILVGPVGSLAQSGGGGSAGAAAAASGPSAGTGSAVGSPNSAGTVNSSGSSAAGTAATGPQTEGDVALDKETKDVDRKLKSICRGC